MVPVKGGWWWGGSYSNKNVRESSKFVSNSESHDLFVIIIYNQLEWLNHDQRLQLWLLLPLHTPLTHHIAATSNIQDDRQGGQCSRHICVSSQKWEVFFFWTNQCSIIYLGSNLQTTHQVGKRELAVTKNVPKQHQTCRLGLGTKVSLFFFFFLFWLIYKLQKMAMRKTGLSDTSGVVS